MVIDMSGLDRIIDEINTDAKAAADKIISEAQAQAERITERALHQTRELKAAAERQAELEYKQIISRAESAASVTVRRALLCEKQRIISEVLQSVTEHFGEMASEQYYSFLTKLLEKYAEPRKGEIILTESAKTRITPDFRDAITQKGLKISEKSHECSGGFILVYGDTEENCTLEALLDAEHDKLHHAISTFLF